MRDPNALNNSHRQPSCSLTPIPWWVFEPIACLPLSDDFSFLFLYPISHLLRPWNRRDDSNNDTKDSRYNTEPKSTCQREKFPERLGRQVNWWSHINLSLLLDFYHHHHGHHRLTRRLSLIPRGFLLSQLIYFFSRLKIQNYGLSTFL